MKIKTLLASIVLLVILTSTSCKFSSEEEEKETQPAQSAQETLQANNLQLTIQVQNMQLTALAATMAAPLPQPQLPATQPPQPQPQATEPPAAPPPPGNIQPSIRTSTETRCYYAITTNPVDDKVLDRIPAGAELPVLYQRVTRQDETQPWQLSYVKVKTGRGCECWVYAREVELIGDVGNVPDAYSATDMGILFGACP